MTAAEERECMARWASDLHRYRGRLAQARDTFQRSSLTSEAVAHALDDIAKVSREAEALRQSVLAVVDKEHAEEAINV